jgi:hypothetical protein
MNKSKPERFTDDKKNFSYFQLIFRKSLRPFVQLCVFLLYSIFMNDFIWKK